MRILDNRSVVKRYDRSGMLGSIESLALQCQQAWDDTRHIIVPPAFRRVRHIVINAMGGSALGADVIRTVFQDRLPLPLILTNQYTVPKFVDRDTLYIVSSYSGTTEEITASIAPAVRARAKLMIICAGGTLARYARQHKIPAYIFTPRFNPSQQPRMAVGYSVAGILGLLCQAGLLKITQSEFNQVIRQIVMAHASLGIARPTVRNVAKQTAQAVHGRVPVIIAAEHLSGIAHVMANQVNENSKAFSNFFLISEMNHHLMEGLRFPRSNKRNLGFIFLESRSYHPRNQRRFAITQRVLTRAGIPFVRYQVKGPTVFAEAMQALTFSGYVGFYGALLNKIDPSPIPVVDYFKKELSRS
ncbi:MAG: hypothetical protein HZC01_02345 [Candidatus Kerfeldbacteria bacterium]|nr:hypothetical protein [Candidatus Kerfeldbacteria bacterium]